MHVLEPQLAPGAPIVAVELPPGDTMEVSLRVSAPFQARKIVSPRMSRMMKMTAKM
jgi:hypothetical protein